MAIQIGAKPDSGFDNPIGMLKDCHRRIEHFLDILCLVAERGHARSLTGEERSAVQAALQYFHVGGERHTADEEESLFPRLRGELTTGNLEEIDCLESDHSRRRRLDPGATINVLVLTYNRTLRGYVNHLATTQTSGALNVNVEIETFANWAKHRLGVNWIHSDSGAKVKSLGGNLDLDPDFLASETEYLTGRFLKADLGTC